MLRVGLTGGIGSGKSTVSAMLAARGATVVDADLIARQVVALDTPGLAALREAFGDQILLPDGSLDRLALGQRVFADPAELARLNAIVHPLVAAETAEQAAAAERAGCRVLVFDVPLLVENGLQGLYDAVVVIATQPSTQRSRLTASRRMSAADVQARIDAQAPLSVKLEAATHVLHNDGALEELTAQVDGLWSELLRHETTRTQNPV